MDLMLKNMLDQLSVLTQCGGIRSYYDNEAPKEYQYKDSTKVFNLLSTCEEVAYHLKKEDVDMAEWLITRFCLGVLFEEAHNYRFPWLEEVTHLCLEYMDIDLANAERTYEIPEEIIEIVKKEIGKEEKEVSETKTYRVSVGITQTGYYDVEARSEEEAKEKIKRITNGDLIEDLEDVDIVNREVLDVWTNDDDE